jgi:hypothetical protein
MLSKGFADLSRAAEGTAPGISWGQRYSYCQASAPAPQLQEQLPYWVEGCTLPIGDALGIMVRAAAAVDLLPRCLNPIATAIHM